MASLKVIAVFDKAIDAFNRPMFVPAVGLAVRSFQDEIAREAPDNPMFAHPQDFSLFLLGEYDESSGRFTCLDVPERVAEASSFSVQENLGRRPA